MDTFLDRNRRYGVAVLFYAGVHVLFRFAVTDILVLIPALTEFNDGVQELTASGGALHNVIYYSILFSGIFWLLQEDVRQDFRTYFVVQRKSLVKVILSGVAFVFLGFVIGFTVRILNILLDVPPAANQALVGSLIVSELAIPFIFVVIVLGPVVEEMIFRTALFRMIKHPVVAVVTSAILFALIHLNAEPTVLSYVVNSLGYFVLGIVFGVIYLRSQKNIAPLMIIHAINNLVSTLLTLLQVSLGE